MRKFIVAIIVFVGVAGLLFASGSKEKTGLPWTPKRPITIIVPWSAGGSTDQVTRIIAGALSQPLGQQVVVVNQPGASGSVGTKTVMDDPHDGYTWAAGAASDLGSYKVLGLLNTNIKNWVLYTDVANVSVVAVNAKSPYKNFGDLLKAFKAHPGQISVGTAGVLSAGHNAIEAIAKYTGITYKHVPYNGGNPAVISTVSGETQVTTQLAVEESNMLQGGRLRALAVLNTKPLKLEGYGEIPPITKWIPQFQSAPNYFGIWIPKDAPKNVIDTFGKLWDTVIVHSQALQKYAASRGAVVDPEWGPAAQKQVMPYLSQVAWNYYKAGKAKISPATIGIPQP